MGKAAESLPPRFSIFPCPPLMTSSLSHSLAEGKGVGNHEVAHTFECLGLQELEGHESRSCPYNMAKDIEVRRVHIQLKDRKVSSLRQERT